jgi:hypothetical protein
MRIVLILLLLATILVAPIRGTAQSKKPAFSIMITTSKNVVTAGSEVRVELIVTNISNQVVTLARENSLNNGELSNSIEVRDDMGTSVHRTNLVRAAKSNESSKDEMSIPVYSSVTISLKPGETLKDGIFVTQLFDLSQPGRYTILVLRKDETSNTIVKSNTITLTVTP